MPNVLAQRNHSRPCKPQQPASDGDYYSNWESLLSPSKQLILLTLDPWVDGARGHCDRSWDALSRKRRGSSACFYSYLSATSGSTFVARRAGIQHATSVTPIRIAVTAAKIL